MDSLKGGRRQRSELLAFGSVLAQQRQQLEDFIAHPTPDLA
jgi:hypothetical protein